MAVAALRSDCAAAGIRLEATPVDVRPVEAPARPRGSRPGWRSTPGARLSTTDSCTATIPSRRTPTWVLGLRMRTSALHHQAIADPGPRWRPTAWADDGIIEGVEWIGGGWLVLGVQWNPELAWCKDLNDPTGPALFAWLHNVAITRAERTPSGTWGFTPPIVARIDPLGGTELDRHVGAHCCPSGPPGRFEFACRELEPARDEGGPDPF